jgi:microcompartment protein CcmK/EutM
MLMGKVVGNVVSTHKDQGMVGFKLLIVQLLDIEMKLAANYVVATDAVGAGLGEVVIVVQGSSARLTELTVNKPVDAAIICIVDSVEISGKMKYQKANEAQPKPELEMLHTAKVAG